MAFSPRQDPLLGAVEVYGMTRAAFILRGALAVGAASGAGAVGPFVGRALGRATRDDEIMRLALSLEYLEATFYERATKTLSLSPDVQALAELLGDHERTHAERLRGVIERMGGTTAQESDLQFRFPITNQASFLKLAITLEENGVSAYNGAAPLLNSTELLPLAGAIVQVEARHTAAVRVAAGQSPAPRAFDRAIGLQEAIANAGPYISRL